MYKKTTTTATTTLILSDTKYSFLNENSSATDRKDRQYMKGHMQSGPVFWNLKLEITASAKYKNSPPSKE